MVAQVKSETTPEIIYPDSDGKPMADNTLQFRWITTIKANLDWLFAENEQVFVAGDLLWYPVEGNNKKRQAPDVMVVFGRPKGERGSYQQWKEDHIAPQVVFEILSPGNTQKEMNKKLLFYQDYGVEEYYIYDPDKNDLSGLLRGESGLEVIENMDGWISPRLGIRFEMAQPELKLYYPNGECFSTYNEERQKVIQERQKAERERQRAEDERQKAEREHQRAEDERQKAERERQKAEREHQRAENERQRADKLAAQLRELGVDLNEIS